MTALEARFWRWTKKRFLWICCAAIFLLGALIRYWYLPLETNDLAYYYARWLENFQRFGLSAAFDVNIEYDYSAIFTYVFTLYAKVFGAGNVLMTIKLTNCFLEIITDGLCLALILSLLPRERRAAGALTGMALLWLNPILFWNTAAWGQVDVYYLLFSVLAVLLLVKGRPGWAFVCLGIALAIKLQTILLLPFFVMAWFCGPKRFSCLWFLALPGAVIVSGLPMMLVGQSPLATLGSYLIQGEGFTAMAINKLNLYTLVGGLCNGISDETLDMFFRTGMMLCMAALGGILVWMVSRKVVLTGRTMVLLAAWCVICCNFLLPRMHDRYAIVGEVLLCCWAVCLHKPRGYVYLLAMTLPTLATYTHALYLTTFLDPQTGGLINLFLFCALTWEAVREMGAPSPEAMTP